MRRWIWSGIIILIIGGIAFAWPFVHRTLSTATDSVTSVISPQPDLRFAVISDNHGDSPIYSRLLDDMATKPFAFVLHLGDASDRGTNEEWAAVRAQEERLGLPVYHTVGNHDIKVDPTRAAFEQAFSTTRWYSKNFSNVHLVVLDNADRKVGFPAEELDWLERDLAAHANDVLLIAYHRPFGLPFAEYTGDDETTASRRTNERFLSILAPYTIAQIFNGHVHTYLPYSLNRIPAVITGGGGDPAQTLLGGGDSSYFHYLDVSITDSKLTYRSVGLPTTPE
jgi:predicted phosphodiesterase